MTAAMLAARRGRPSFDGLRGSLDDARAANLRLIESNTNLALELRARRTEALVFAGAVRVLGHRVRYGIEAGLIDVAHQAGYELEQRADRRLAQLGSVTL